MGKRLAGKTSGSEIDALYFPNVNAFLHRPMLSDPPMCTLKELQDGTYSIIDLTLMNELLDLKISLSNKSGK